MDVSDIFLVSVLAISTMMFAALSILLVYLLFKERKKVNDIRKRCLELIKECEEDYKKVKLRNEDIAKDGDIKDKKALGEYVDNHYRMGALLGKAKAAEHIMNEELMVSEDGKEDRWEMWHTT